MGYRKRYEDSYLDDDEKDTDEIGKTDSERIIALLEKSSRNITEEERIKRLTDRLLEGAKVPGPSGVQAIGELTQIARKYTELGGVDSGMSIWLQISDIAGLVGNKELYYQAMEEITKLNSVIYQEHHPEDSN